MTKRQWWHWRDVSSAPLKLGDHVILYDKETGDVMGEATVLEVDITNGTFAISGIHDDLAPTRKELGL